MNFVFISPHFPSNYQHFCIQLHKLGVNVLGIGDVPFDTLDVALKEALTEYSYIPDMGNYNEILRICGYFTHRYGKIDRIESNNEHWLEIDAQLRDDFNVRGMRTSDIERIKFKSFMKEEFRKADLIVPEGKVISSIKGAKKFIKKVGYPVVAKPDKGVGATGTHKLHNEDELRSFFAKKDKNPYIMEEYINGKICSFDGLLDQNGKVVFYCVHQNCDNAMDIVHHDLHTAYYSLREIDEDIKKQGFKVLEILNITERFFHIEFFRRPNNELVALEINMRPPGGLTLDMFNYANDIDIYQEWANIVVNNTFKSKYNYPYYCSYISRKSSKSYTYTHQEILEKYQNLIVHHTSLAPMYWSAMGNYGYVIRDVNLDKIFEVKEYIHC